MSCLPLVLVLPRFSLLSTHLPYSISPSCIPYFTVSVSLFPHHPYHSRSGLASACRGCGQHRVCLPRHQSNRPVKSNRHQSNRPVKSSAPLLTHFVGGEVKSRARYRQVTPLVRVLLYYLYRACPVTVRLEARDLSEPHANYSPHYDLPYITSNTLPSPTPYLLHISNAYFYCIFLFHIRLLEAHSRTAS